MKVAVIDIGKTNAKLALVETRAPGGPAEIAVRRRPNRVLPGPPWPHADLDGLWQFLLGALGEIQAAQGIEAITATTHGAAAVLLDAAGGLAAPMLDYEHPGPDALAAAYDALRPPFALTGSPRLPLGLNLGAQIHWQLAVDPGLAARLARVVTYPQYWSGRLTGQWRTEATSLGSHSDLWEPHAARISPLAQALGIAGKFAPLAAAGEVLGPVLPEIAARTGLPPGTPVLCGLHDSNASLYPYLLAGTAPFAVVSTGTWVISMAIGGRTLPLDAARDTLINVAATGQAVPSARFMGGREREMVMAGDSAPAGADDIAAALATGAMLLPSVERHSGPFQGRQMRWHGPEPRGRERAAAVAFYLALMTATGLDLIGAEGPVMVEGPLARDPAYVAMLSAALARPVRAASGSATGTSIGAALLADPGAPLPAPGEARTETGAAWTDYAAAWRQAVSAR